MQKNQQKTISKFMSLVLRHRPELAGLALGEGGWVEVERLLQGMADAGHRVNREQLASVVADNDKQRFQFSDDRESIRATQGHSVDVDLGYESAIPPAILVHGTPQKFVASIKAQGLLKQARHHVHLHENRSLAASVGQRRGAAVVLSIDALRMYEAGHTFFVTPNNVWLTDHVPAEFITFPASK